jgi:hypothetical protein
VTDSENPNPSPVVFAPTRSSGTVSTPHPKGTRFVNHRDELDDDDGVERITPAGNVWEVVFVDGENRHIGCEATGAVIIPTIAELHEQFTLWCPLAADPQA